MDSRDRFTATADAYAVHRPTYPSELIDWITHTAKIRPNSRVCDVGCGTGISTRLFAKRGYRVTGIDPNKGMLNKARELGGADYQLGDAANTGLGEASVELVIAAQAFHWFDVATTLSEWRRILVEDGWCAVFWNVRANTPFMKAYETLLNTIGDYRAVPKPSDAIARIEAYLGQHAASPVEFLHSQSLNREGLLGRAASSSYVAHGVTDRAAFDQELLALFDHHQRDDRVEFAYAATARMWPRTSLRS